MMRLFFAIGSAANTPSPSIDDLPRVIRGSVGGRDIASIVRHIAAMPELCAARQNSDQTGRSAAISTRTPPDSPGTPVAPAARPMGPELTVIVGDASRLAAIRTGVQFPGRAMHFTTGNVTGAMESIRAYR